MEKIPIENIIKEYEKNADYFSIWFGQQLRLELDKFDGRDRYLCTYSYTLPELAEAVPYYDLYYYRLHLLKGYEEKTGRRKQQSIHFGQRVKDVGSFKISLSYFIENYLNYLIRNYKKEKEQTEQWTSNYFLSVLYHIKWYQEKMEKLARLTTDDIDRAVSIFLESSNCAKEVLDLNTIAKKSGIYMLVLDGYHCCYIGQSVDMKTRILKHWNKKSYYTGTGIDMFRAGDTTRIFSIEIDDPQKEKLMNSKEIELIKKIPSKTTLNVLRGGTFEGVSREEIIYLPIFRKDKDNEQTPLQ